MKKIFKYLLIGLVATVGLANLFMFNVEKKEPAKYILMNAHVNLKLRSLSSVIWTDHVVAIVHPNHVYAYIGSETKTKDLHGLTVYETYTHSEQKELHVGAKQIVIVRDHQVIETIKPEIKKGSQ